MRYEEVSYYFYDSQQGLSFISKSDYEQIKQDYEGDRTKKFNPKMKTICQHSDIIMTDLDDENNEIKIHAVVRTSLQILQISKSKANFTVKCYQTNFFKCRGNSG